MRAAALVAPLLVAGCQAGEEAADAPVAAPEQAVPHDQGGRIVDLASALSQEEKTALGQRLAYQQQADGRSVMVIVLETGKGQSLEQVGWAVGGGKAPGGPFLLLVDPSTRRVRIEGDLNPERKAVVAAAMQSDLNAGRVAAAIDRGLVQLERLAP